MNSHCSGADDMSSQPLFQLTAGGLRLQRQGCVLVDSAPDWLELAFGTAVVAAHG